MVKTQFHDSLGLAKKCSFAKNHGVTRGWKSYGHVKGNYWYWNSKKHHKKFAACSSHKFAMPSVPVRGACHVGRCFVFSFGRE